MVYILYCADIIMNTISVMWFKFQINSNVACCRTVGVKKLSEKINNTSYHRMERRSATKRSRRHAKDEAVTSYWNNQRVVPTKVNGKTTYVIISTRSSSDEHSGRGCGTRHQELFPPEVTRHNVPCTSGSGLRRHTVSKYHAVDIVASHNGTDISPTCSKGHGKDCRFYANGGSSSGEASVISLAQKYEQEMFVTEKPSTTLDNAEEAIVQGSSNSSLHNTYKQSAVVVQESLTSDEQDVEASPNLLGSDMVIQSNNFLLIHFSVQLC